MSKTPAANVLLLLHELPPEVAGLLLVTPEKEKYLTVDPKQKPSPNAEAMAWAKEHLLEAGAYVLFTDELKGGVARR